jgi:Methane/Phenol/Toluene Hydroxylase
MNVVIRPTLDHILLRQFANAAHDAGDEATWLLLGNLAVDADRCTRWSTALAQYAIEQRAGNRDVLQRWVARWTPRAEAAAAGLGQLFEQLPSGGRSADCGERLQLVPAPGTQRGRARGIGRHHVNAGREGRPRSGLVSARQMFA